MRAYLTLAVLFFLPTVPTLAAAEEKPEAKHAQTEHFEFEYGAEFEHESKDSPHGKIHLLRFNGPQPKEGQIPKSVQITVVEMTPLNRIREENPKKNPSELAIGALGGIVLSHRDKLKQLGALLAVSDVSTVVLRHLNGATQEIHMNMFKAAGMEQYSDYYVLTDGKNFLHIQGIYFPKHGAESQKRIDLVLESARTREED
ncbi:MAG: hypothetical protein KDD66_14525 [Bdellovibrionales bacterium]|nr:hypothetical protein [Bdellovibrionales bacterium]